MALTREEKASIIARAHAEPVFCKNLLKELIRLAVTADPDVLEKALKKIQK